MTDAERFRGMEPFVVIEPDGTRVGVFWDGSVRVLEKGEGSGLPPTGPVSITPPASVHDNALLVAMMVARRNA